MNKSEIALSLTLKAIETKALRFNDWHSRTKDDLESANELNVKQVTEFYNYILNNINE